MAHQAVVTFTARGSARVIQEHGSGCWRLNEERMKGIDFLVCTQNQHNGDWGGADHPHRSAFLVGKVSGTALCPDRTGRKTITMSEYALINIPEVWDKSRFPVRYTTLEDLGIDPARLNFRPVDSPSLSVPVASGDIDECGEAYVVRSMVDIKRVIAMMHNRSEKDVDITIRY